jgi:hypothetical protein
MVLVSLRFPTKVWDMRAPVWSAERVPSSGLAYHKRTTRPTAMITTKMTMEPKPKAVLRGLDTDLVSAQRWDGRTALA